MGEKHPKQGEVLYHGCTLDVGAQDGHRLPAKMAQDGQRDKEE